MCWYKKNMEKSGWCIAKTMEVSATIITNININSITIALEGQSVGGVL